MHQFEFASDMLGYDASQLNPIATSVYQDQGIMPKASSDLLLYIHWASVQPAGTDASVDAYLAYVDTISARTPTR